MKLILSAVVAVLTSACSTVVPVTVGFPEAPKFATQACPDLQKLTAGAQLSDVANTVNANYATYYECAVKTDAWQEWYRIQKNIFESAK